MQKEMIRRIREKVCISEVRVHALVTHRSDDRTGGLSRSALIAVFVSMSNRRRTDRLLAKSKGGATHSNPLTNKLYPNVA